MIGVFDDFVNAFNEFINFLSVELFDLIIDFPFGESYFSYVCQTRYDYLC